MIELQTKVRNYMSEYRYLHTLSVVNECEKLAGLFDIDSKKLIICAYLHDITKEMSTEDQIKLFCEYGDKPTQDTLDSPKTMHAFSAPLLIKKDFPEYADRTVLQAVKYHCTGRANMNLYDKLLYLADYIEPTRKFKDCIELRRFFYEGNADNKNNGTDTDTDKRNRLDETILLSLKYTISDLIKNSMPIHKQTINAYNFLVTKSGGKK